LVEFNEGRGLAYSVEVVAIDGIVLREERPIDFLKCDAEGADIAVLRGARNILAEDKPLVVVEAEMPVAAQPHPRVDEYREMLEPLGYRGFSFDYDGELWLGPIGTFCEGHANVGFVHRTRLPLLANTGGAQTLLS
jgi:hypothetical protein